jgi:hypothetical protein
MLIPPSMLTPKAISLGLVSGAAAGSLVGMVANRIVRRAEPPMLTALLVDAILGAVGFVGGAIAIASLHLVESTTSTQAGGMIIRTTARHTENAYRLALGIAVLLAALYEVIRYRIKRPRPSPA